jgi:NAD(P)-dependent dehydrogenase (short-subunit alcohol dehydrogenase family)
VTDDRFLITGASRGIGREIAVAISRPERTLVLTGRNQTNLQETARLVEQRGASARVWPADLADTVQIEGLVASLKGARLAGLISNAGMAVVKPVDELTLEDWQRTLDVNVTGPFELIRRLLPLLNEGASIVNISSVAARTAFPGWSSYCMSKAAMEGFVRGLREELRPRGVRVVNIAPSATATDMWREVPGDWDTSKMMTAEQVAMAVAFALDRPDGVLVEEIRIGALGGNL